MHTRSLLTATAMLFVAVSCRDDTNSLTEVNAGAQHTCGKTPADVAYYWRSNLLGAPGGGTWQNIRTTPRPVGGAM